MEQAFSIDNRLIKWGTVTKRIQVYTISGNDYTVVQTDGTEISYPNGSINTYSDLEGSFSLLNPLDIRDIKLYDTYTVKLGDFTQYSNLKLIYTASSVKISNGDLSELPSTLTNINLQSSDGNYTGDVLGVSNCIYVIFKGVNTVYGDITSLNPNSVSIEMRGFNTVGGDISNHFSSSLVQLIFYGNGALTGDLSTLNTTNLDTLRIQGSGGNTVYGQLNWTALNLTICIINTLGNITGNYSDINAPTLGILQINSTSSSITGSMASLPNSLGNFSGPGVFGDLGGMPAFMGFLNLGNYANTNLDSYTGFNFSGVTAQYYRIEGNSSLSSAEVDQFLIDASTATWAGLKQIQLLGNCQPRTSASDAAVATLQSLGVTVTTN